MNRHPADGLVAASPAGFLRFGTAGHNRGMDETHSDSAGEHTTLTGIRPSQPPRPRRLRRPVLVALGALVLGAGVLVALAVQTPAFYRRAAVPPADEPAAEQAARRLVTDLSALRADFGREGGWEASLTEEGINAWLATDLTRNHARALPDGVSTPRIAFTPGRVHAAARLGAGGLSAVAWLVAGVNLREPNQLGVVVEQAGLGGLPLPRGPVLRELARRCERLGMVATVRRLDDRNVLVVYIPSTHEAGGTSHWLEALAIGAGDVAVAGRTVRGPLRPAAGQDTR